MNNISSVIRQAVTAVVLLFVGLACALTASAQGNLPPTWVFARAYNGWSIIGQQPNTYSFNGGACNYFPYNNGNTPSFFVFSGLQGATTVYYPVAIVDANPSSSEIVTPSSTLQSSASCGFNGTVQNQHTSFQLQSGTAGLQEAIVTQQQSAPVFDVILDKYWYQSVSALPGSPTSQSIIAAVTGNVNVGIVDTTSMPWTFYAWNGTKYAAVSATGSQGFTSVTPIAAPAALSTSATTNGIITTASTGGTIASSAGTFRLAATYVTNVGGETLISTDTASTSTIAVGSSTATNSITVTSPAAETGAVGWRVYMSAASGASKSEILYVSSCASASTGQIVLNGVCAIGSSATVTALVTGTATVPAISSAVLFPSASTSVGQNLPVSYPPFTNLTTISAGASGTLGEVNLYPGFLNSLGRHLKIHGTGFATTNGTAGTLTFALGLASVPGVTSITPFTAVSGTTTASAVVNFEFDVDVTTAAVGTSGTLEAHGTVCYNLAGGAVCVPAMDLITAVSSAIDLTKQDQLEFTLTPATTAVTTGGAQLRQLTVQVLQ